MVLGFSGIRDMPFSKSAGWAMLFAFRLSKPHADCLRTTIAVLSNLKFYLLPFSKGTIVHPLKLVAVEE
jgi:hypothetical protein